MHKFLNTLKNIDIEINVLFFFLYYFCVAFAWLFHGYITVNWPTRQLSDGTFLPTTNSPTRPLADTTSHRQFFLKTHRHSPTLTDRNIPRKRMKRNFFAMSILLYFRNEHITTLLSVNTNTCTCVMASFSLYGY